MKLKIHGFRQFAMWLGLAIALVIGGLSIPVWALDLDGDTDTDVDDVNIIISAFNAPVTNPDDQRDLDGDGEITLLDARVQVTQCDRPLCARGNIAPTLNPIGEQTVDEMSKLSFVASASDPNLPADKLSFSLAGTIPPGASIASQTGIFNWTPSEAQGAGVYSFDVVVMDNGIPNLSDSETITVTVAECTEDSSGALICGACPDGYNDVNGDGSQCENIDECMTGTASCDALATCTDTPGAFTCICPADLEDIFGDGSVCQGATTLVPAGATKFVASVLLQDVSKITGQTRQSTQPVTLYYEEGQPGSIGNQWMRQNIPTVDGEITDFYRYGGFNLRWTHWQNSCASDDISDYSFPILYTAGGMGAQVSSDLTLLDGTVVSANQLRLFVKGGTQLYVNRVTGRPIRAVYSTTSLDRQIDFIGNFDSSGTFDSKETFQPTALFKDDGSGKSVCTSVRPSCYRQDVVFVMDGSGSMLPSWQKQVRFVEEFAQFQRVSANLVKIGYQVFRTKAFTAADKLTDPACCTSDQIEQFDLSDDFGEFDSALQTLDTIYPWTPGDTTHGGLVDGIRMAFNNLKENGRHKQFARQIVVAFTDSAGSSPCRTLDELSLDDLEAGVSYTEYLGDNTNCEVKHNAYLTELYNRIDSDLVADPTGFNPDVFILGVGAPPLLKPTVDLIARIGSEQLSNSLIPGNPEVARQQVDSWSNAQGLNIYERMLDDALNRQIQCPEISRINTRCDESCLRSGTYCCAGACCGP